jgi:FkbM family methyltransferase
MRSGEPVPWHLRTRTWLRDLLRRVVGPRRPEVENVDARHNRDTIAIMRRVLRADSSAVDVGAYTGEITSALLEIAPLGRHLVLEPQPELAAALRERFSTLRVIWTALGDRRGTTSFVQALDNPPYSGLRPQQYPTPAERTRSISVPIARLDDLVEGGAPVAFIKIDTEGAEYEILRGAARTILRDGPVIVFEYGLAGMESFGTTPTMMWHLLHEELELDVTSLAGYLANAAPYDADGFRDSGEYMFVAYPRASAMAPALATGGAAIRD